MSASQILLELPVSLPAAAYDKQRLRGSAEAVGKSDERPEGEVLLAGLDALKVLQRYRELLRKAFLRQSAALAEFCDASAHAAHDAVGGVGCHAADVADIGRPRNTNP